MKKIWSEFLVVNGDWYLPFKVGSILRNFSNGKMSNIKVDGTEVNNVTLPTGVLKQAISYGDIIETPLRAEHNLAELKKKKHDFYSYTVLSDERP